MTAVLFADIEQLLCTWLPAQLAARGFTVPVGTRVPNPRPASFLRVLAVGGARRNLVADQPTVAIEAWAPTEAAASALARTARAVIESAAGLVIDGVTVHRSRDFSSPVNLPDPVSAQCRYTFTGTMIISGAEL